VRGAHVALLSAQDNRRTPLEGKGRGGGGGDDGCEEREQAEGNMAADADTVVVKGLPGSPPPPYPPPARACILHPAPSLSPKPGTLHPAP